MRWRGTARRRWPRGCDEFDTKPIEFERLLAKIELALAAKPGG